MSDTTGEHAWCALRLATSYTINISLKKRLSVALPLACPQTRLSFFHSKPSTEPSTHKQEAP